MDVDEYDIGQPLSITNKLFLEDSLDQLILPTILEEEATSQNNSLDNNQPITTQFDNIPNITEPIRLKTTDESMYQTNGNNLLPIVSQTQTELMTHIQTLMTRRAQS